MAEGDDEILGVRAVDSFTGLRSIEVFLQEEKNDFDSIFIEFGGEISGIRLQNSILQEDFAMELSLFSWIWGRKPREVPKLNPWNFSSSSSSSTAAGAAVSGRLLDASRSPAGETWRARRRRRTDPRVDKEHDAVVVPPDGGCFSCSDSDEEDWAVGWLEPPGPDFRSSEDSFAVLVPCYDRAPGNDDPPGELLFA